MNLWYIAAIASGLGVFSSNYRVVGMSVWVFGFSLLQLAVAWGLMG